MDYPHISFDRLVGMRQLLEELAVDSQGWPDVLKHLAEVKDEMEIRQFRLLGRWDGSVRELGRWRTAEQCERDAELMGLPVGSYQLEGKPLEIVVLHVP
jgi:hypothetical protein